MAKIFSSKKINLYLLLLLFQLIKSEDIKPFVIKQLKFGSFSKYLWNTNESYIYYIDIHNYKLGQENVFQILSETNKLMHNLTVSEINESIIFDNKSEIIKKETYNISFHIKLRPKPKRYYYEVLIKKTDINQKYFVILIEPKIYQNTEVVLTISTIIPVYNITKKDISDGKVFSRIFYMNAKIEKFFKFNIKDISLKKQNLILLVGDKSVSSFYLNTITSKERRSKVLIIQKNTTYEVNHVIYLSLLGPTNKTKFQITLDEHDISYSYGVNRDLTSFYIERLNCSKDYYIFQNYITYVDEKLDINYHLDINSIYGDYNMTYYENIGSNISSIFNPDNDTMEILDENYLKKISGDFSVLKLSCKSPTLLKLNYFNENINLNISEGQEKIVHLDKCLSYYDIYKNNHMKITDMNKKYQFYFGYYKLKETKNEKIKTILKTSIYNYETLHLSDNPDYIIIDSYYEKNKPEKYFSVEVTNDNMYYKLYLISNQYYKNVVEGLTKINYNENSIAFKIRKDICFDYFIFKSYSFNKEIMISLEYDLKIAKKNDIQKDKVMLGMTPVREILKKEINIRFSNPYNKFNSRLQDEDNVYLLVHFMSNEPHFPIYVDIRYYYNNSIISLKPSGTNILLNNEEYKIYGEKDTNFEKILLNINKCDISKNYTIKTFYENNDNLLLLENITNERTFLFHENLFNNTKIVFNENYNNKNNSINNYNNNIFLQQASYYKTGDLYMNYFPVKENIYNELSITKNFSILIEDSYNTTSFEWNDYISNKNNNFSLNYSIYILPKSSPINSICQMALIPPNISLINKTKYQIFLDKGEYKMSIIASVMNNKFPFTTYYDFIEFSIPKKYNIRLIIIICAICLILIIFLIFLIIYCKKKPKDELDNLLDESKSRLMSVARVLGLGDEQEGIIINNDKEDKEENEQKSINNRKDSKGEKDGELKENVENDDFRISSDK